MMLRVFFVAIALIGMASAAFEREQFPQTPIDQAQWNGQTFQLSQSFFYFCHSYCTFQGEYDFQRFWAEPDPNFVEMTNIFDWSADGSLDFWATSNSNSDDDCDAVIEYYRYAPTCTSPCSLTYSESRLNSCKPEWIYIENVEIKYTRDKGQFYWQHYINDAFMPTDASWERWTTIAADAKRGNNVGDVLADNEYDLFDGLLRYYPDADDSSLTSRYRKDYFYRETYISNYEPNYCTMQMPHKSIDTKLWCNGNIIDDSDDSDDLDYPTREYCIARGAWIEEYDVYDFGCGIGDSDDCDTVRFYNDPNSRRTLAGRTTPSKTEKLRQATSNSAKLAQYEKRGFASYFSPDDLFYYQNYAAGLQFPFCAVRGGNGES